jgi:hypothetical protein
MGVDVVVDGPRPLPVAPIPEVKFAWLWGGGGIILMMTIDEEYEFDSMDGCIINIIRDGMKLRQLWRRCVRSGRFLGMISPASSLWSLKNMFDRLKSEGRRVSREQLVNWLELVEIKRSSFEISEVEGMLVNVVSRLSFWLFFMHINKRCMRSYLWNANMRRLFICHYSQHSQYYTAFNLYVYTCGIFWSVALLPVWEWVDYYMIW